MELNEAKLDKAIILKISQIINYNSKIQSSLATNDLGVAILELQIAGIEKDTSLYFFQNILGLGDQIFNYFIYYPDNIFKGIRTLPEQIVISSRVKDIGSGCFAQTNVKKVVIENNANLKLISDNCFSKSDLEEIQIGSGIEAVRRYAFDGCKNLKLVQLPDSIKTIEKDAFRGCSNNMEIDLPESAEELELGGYDEDDAITAFYDDVISLV